MTEPWPLLYLCIKDKEPVPKGRPRVNKETGSVYTPKRTKDAESDIGWLVKQRIIHIPYDLPLSEPVKVMLTFYTAKQITDTKCPDLDNCTKLVLDALNKIVWSDDRYVTEIDAKMVHGHTHGGTTLKVYLGG